MREMRVLASDEVCPGVNVMDARRLMLPAAALVGAAVLGRLVGLKGLVRAGMAALTVANVSKSAGLLTAGQRNSHKPVQRSTRKRAAQRKSAPKKKAAASSGTNRRVA
jgi:hypothetical protein